MSQLKIYDTKSQRKRVFNPINTKNIRIYVCGMTVYDYCHIGHARVMIAFDIIVRYLRHKYGKNHVHFVRNITDIDDKIIQYANKNNEDPVTLSKRFIKAMNKDMESLSLIKPNNEPYATKYIPQMIDLIQRLIDNGYAYVAKNRDVYYKVRQFEYYGNLSKRTLTKLKFSKYIEDTVKNDPLDFVLWKTAKPQEPSWNSPWGPGRPGWHLECSAMSTHLLGKTFDIHGGGSDLIFPHHENECAQSVAATGEEFVKYWVHVGFLNINKHKMSKSLCNFITINEILKKIDSEELRFFMISGHYRSSLDYSFNNIKQAQHSLKRLYIALHDDGTSNDLSSSSLTIKEESKKYSMQFYEAMNDDFNTPKALSVLFDLARKINQTQDPELKYLLKKLGGILGLLQKSPNKILGNLDITFLDQQIQNLLTKRNLARKKKNWIEADNIRDKLINMGIKINDTKIGMTLHKNSNT